MWSLTKKDSGAEKKAEALITMFRSFEVEMEVADIKDGRSALYIELTAQKPVRMKTLKEFEDDACYALGARAVHIEAPIKGTSRIGVTIPKETVEPLTWRDALDSDALEKFEKRLAIPLGKDEFNNDVVVDVFSLQHLLVTGSTGTGKSTLVHTILTTLISRCTTEQLRLILVDPRHVEMTLYNNIPHLLTPVITEARKTLLALKWMNKEMDRRYQILQNTQSRTIEMYHEKVVAPALAKESVEGEMPEAMPYLVMVIEDLSDLMSKYPREAEAAIVPLLMMSRAVGIHIILTTSRVNAKSLPAMIKVNCTSCITFRTASTAESKWMLDRGGAENLRMSGDALFVSYGNGFDMKEPLRIQTPLITEAEVQAVVAEIKNNFPNEEDEFASQLVPAEDYWMSNGKSIFTTYDQPEEDDMYPEAVEAVREAGKASTSYLQRKLGIGYSRAAHLIDLLEQGGVIGPGDGAKPREVLEPDEE